MSKRSYLYRYMLIIRKLQKKEATFEEISEYLQSKFELQGDDYDKISIRTFQRDRQEILSLYSIAIEYDFRRKVYYISEEAQSDLSLRTLEAFEMFNALKMSESFGQYVHVEKLKPKGIEYFHEIFQAIKNRNVALVYYQKFDDDEPVEHPLEPYALKESKGRWYLIGRNTAEGYITVLALDRIHNFVVNNEKYKKSEPAWDVNEYFKDCFGVTRPHNANPQKVILSFTPDQGKYIKTLRLHESQTLLADNDEEYRIELYLYLTYDFMKELMSHGNTVKIISPAKLRKDIQKEYSEALKQYLPEFL